MVKKINTYTLLRLCRAWEMNNGEDGYNAFMRDSGLPLIIYGLYEADVGEGSIFYEEWVVEKSLHKAIIRWADPLIAWLDSLGHGD